MVKLQTFEDINTALAKYVPLAAHITGRNITLGRMKPLMELFGNPQEKLKIIHIAGTSGKTSTAYFITSLLTNGGLKTGLTVSPHVDSVAERIQINLLPLEEAKFASSLQEFINILENSEIEPTYFELLVAFAYWYFEKQKVDYAVIETGMGGLHDGTNIAANHDKLCVITDIGMDHMHVLGNTVEEIAAQKSGIIHAENQVLMFEQPEEISQVFANQCKSVGATMDLLHEEELAVKFENNNIFLTLPEFQRRNWLLAYETYEWLRKRDNLPELTQEQIESSMHIQVPGRMDMIEINGKKIIMDGAHNEQKMQAFVQSFMSKFPDRRIPVLLSLKEGKEFAAVLPILKPIVSTLIVTEFQFGQDIPSHAINAHELAMVARQFGFDSVFAELDIERALNKLLQLEDDTVIITGSFYLLGQLRHQHPEFIHA